VAVTVLLQYPVQAKKESCIQRDTGILPFPEIYVPHRPILAKFRLGFWQIVCPGHRNTVG